MSTAPSSTRGNQTRRIILQARRTGAQTVGHRDNYKRTTLTPDHRIIRAWALDNGRTVTAGSRIRPTVLRADHDAH